MPEVRGNNYSGMPAITEPYAWKIAVLTAYTITLAYKYKTVCTLECFEPKADKAPVEHFT